MSLWNSPFSVEFKVCITISFKSKLAKAQPKSDPTAPRLWVRKNLYLPVCVIFSSLMILVIQVNFSIGAFFRWHWKDYRWNLSGQSEISSAANEQSQHIIVCCLFAVPKLYPRACCVLF